MKKLMIEIGVAGTLAITSRSPVGVARAATFQSAGIAAATPSAVVATAEAHLGDRYATIGNSPATGFSCIGFVNYVFAQNGVYVPFDIPQAWNSAPRVAMDELLPGDVLFFSNTVFAGLSHVAIYIGGGEMIGADNFSVGVTTDRLSDSYWTAHYTGATRSLALSGTSPAPGAGQPTVTVTATATATPSPESGDPGQTVTPTPTPAPENGSAWQVESSTTTPSHTSQAAASAPSGTLLRLLAPVVGLYSGPGYQYMFVANANAGSLLIVLLAQGGWYYARNRAATHGPLRCYSPARPCGCWPVAPVGTR
ncbi:MAG TPA: NlpC/P60 family protein [Chloroflexota bacterium]|nr:NlpC/P60 family protein [Chloroflexota bacterium]